MRIEYFVAAPLLGSLLTIILGCDRSVNSQGIDPTPQDLTQRETHVSQPAVLEVPFSDQVRAVEALQSSRIFVTTKVTDTQLAALPQLDGLHDLLLDAGEISDTGLLSFDRFPNLKHLRFRMSRITDAGLKQIAKIETLQMLNLPHAACTAKGLGHLKSLSNLHQLRLGSDLASADVCRPLSQFAALRSIHLIDIPVDDVNLMLLASIKSLQSLYLDGANVSDEGWARLFQERPDLHIHVNQKHHDLDPGSHDD